MSYNTDYTLDAVKEELENNFDDIRNYQDEEDHYVTTEVITTIPYSIKLKNGSIETISLKVYTVDGSLDKIEIRYYDHSDAKYKTEELDIELANSLFYDLDLEYELTLEN